MVTYYSAMLTGEFGKVKKKLIAIEIRFGFKQKGLAKFETEIKHEKEVQSMKQEVINTQTEAKP